MRTFRTLRALSSMGLCAAVMLGCTEDGDAPATSSAPDATAAAETEGDTAAAGAPQFLTFNTNTQTLRSDGTLVFTVILTHPDGAGQVIGGTLTDPGTGSSYGAFITQATQGAYTLQLDWNQINAVAAIDTPAGGAPRVFRATFFDQRGHEASRDLTIQLVCATATLAACDGMCVDLTTSKENCGACGVPAPGGRCDGGVPACEDSRYTACLTGCKLLSEGDIYNCGACAAECPKHEFGITRSCSESHCRFEGDSYVAVSCEQFCQAQGGTCESGTVYPTDGTSAAIACNTTPTSSDFGHVTCKCLD